uniref:F-box domain-containing protein n=1 Tax=Riptortus pedestris TaxID=329032 RepID=R4WE11_RIPPE|nr:conserved hypothetical protein [Riptortus pedestris]
MPKGGNKKGRLSSLNPRIENQKISDVTLAEFADSKRPGGKGRLRKSKNILTEVRQISTVEDVTTEILDDVDGQDRLIAENNEVKSSSEIVEVNNNQFTDYPLKIWLLLAEYISPEEITSFSLICKATLSVVNTAHFWIRLYKRYYKRTAIPKCLSRECLEVRCGIKQKVVRSLFYFYPPFVSSICNNNASLDAVTGHLCLRHWVHCSEAKDSSEESKWIYNFKLCNRNLNEIFKNKKKYLHDIHYNPEKGCTILQVVWKEFIVLPNVMGSKLRSVVCSPKTISLQFSSAPLSKMVNEVGSIKIQLEHCQRPRLIPWWHPDYWDHTICCRRKSKIQGTQ